MNWMNPDSFKLTLAQQFELKAAQVMTEKASKEQLRTVFLECLEAYMRQSNCVKELVKIAAEIQ